jgi:hypothetical protein
MTKTQTKTTTKANAKTKPVAKPKAPAIVKRKLARQPKAKPPIVDAPPSCCPKCGSTERTDYANTTRVAYNGIHKGREYTHVVWRSTSCLACGQRRRDRSYEVCK